MNILITGGASGLGKSIVEKLAGNTGNKIWFTYANSAEEAIKITTSLKNTQAVHCDFTNKDSIASLTGSVAEMDIDILINNAMTGLQKIHFHKWTPEAVADDFNLNVIPVVRITQACILHFRKKKSGKIINILSSVVANKPPTGWSVYTANKAYLLSLSRSWATENIRFNITSNSVSPSFMQTKLTEDTDPRILEEMLAQHPLKKLLTIEDVAAYVEFLSSCTQQINGTNLLMNAGMDLI